MGRNMEKAHAQGPQTASLKGKLNKNWKPMLGGPGRRALQTRLSTVFEDHCEALGECHEAEEYAIAGTVISRQETRLEQRNVNREER